MLNEAMDLLRLQYEQCMEIVKDDTFFKRYAMEKWRHSFQVAGAGNYLIRHVNWLCDKTPQYIDMVQTAILLHDVCRFTEIVYKFRREGACNHGFSGAALLKNTPMFHDIRIWLPIKYHGCLINDLYADEDYRNIQDATLKREVELICFLIRDADKIANLNMLVHEADMRHLFLGCSEYHPEVDGMVSSRVKDAAFVETTAPRFDTGTVADYMVGYVSWFMDTNYRSAMDYCDKLGVMDGIFKMFDDYCTDEAFKSDYTTFVRRYLHTHRFLD